MLHQLRLRPLGLLHKKHMAWRDRTRMFGIGRQHLSTRMPSEDAVAGAVNEYLGRHRLPERAIVQRDGPYPSVLDRRANDVRGKKQIHAALFGKVLQDDGHKIVVKHPVVKRRGMRLPPPVVQADRPIVGQLPPDVGEHGTLPGRQRVIAEAEICHGAAGAQAA